MPNFTLFFFSRDIFHHCLIQSDIYHIYMICCYVLSAHLFLLFFCTTYHILLQSPSSLQHTGFIGQSCQTLRDPMDYSPLASSVHAILQARILEWFVIYSSNLNSPAMSIMSINHPSKSNISHDPALNVSSQGLLACTNVGNFIVRIRHTYSKVQYFCLGLINFIADINLSKCLVTIKNPKLCTCVY